MHKHFITVYIFVMFCQIKFKSSCGSQCVGKNKTFPIFKRFFRRNNFDGRGRGTYMLLRVFNLLKSPEMSTFHHFLWNDHQNDASSWDAIIFYSGGQLLSGIKKWAVVEAVTMKEQSLPSHINNQIYFLGLWMRSWECVFSGFLLALILSYKATEKSKEHNHEYHLYNMVFCTKDWLMYFSPVIFWKRFWVKLFPC